MMVATEIELRSEMEEELEEEQVFELNPQYGYGSRSLADPIAAAERGQMLDCPRLTRTSVSGFPRYSSSVSSLPRPEQTKIRGIANLILRSFRPGCQPVRVIRLVGYTDRDLPRERREPGFMMKIGGERAHAVKHAMERLINNRAILSRIAWRGGGAGASRPVVSHATTDRERMRNDRVEIVLTTERPDRVRIANGHLRTAMQEMAATRCPPDRSDVVRGFHRYSVLIPVSERDKLRDLARTMTSRKSAGTLDYVQIVAHADRDPVRESREPGFLHRISQQRADAVREYLEARLDFSLRRSTTYVMIGRGATELAVPDPRTEAERACNRRAEITLVRLPQLNPDQSNAMAAEQGTFLQYYHITLQGTSGQYEKPQLAEEKAREIADKCFEFVAGKAAKSWEYMQIFTNNGGTQYFKDALQGTASKFSDPQVVINNAFEIAENAMFGQAQEKSKLTWKYASPLPQPMGADCKIVRGKIPGAPANHVLCGTHGHIIDTTTRMVIAHNLEEYKKLPKRSR
jgi:outer membrane protein OmpA-like peptidoglycan-associated protein